MPVIIVEGADCSGKDTLIETLSRMTGYSVVRGSSFEISKKGKEAMHDIMIDTIEKDNIIMNRSYYSNLVYADIFGYPKIGDDLAKSVTDKINNSENVFVVYLYADKNILKERMKSRGDDEVSPDDLQSILEGYKVILSGKFSPKKLMVFDTGLVDADKIAHTLMNNIVS